MAGKTAAEIDEIRAGLGLDPLGGTTTTTQSGGGLTFGGTQGDSGTQLTWADMSPVQRMAHSIKYDTEYHTTVDDPAMYAAALRYLEKDPQPGFANPGDSLAELYAFENTQAQQQEQAASNEYGFSNAQQSAYDQLIANGVVNPDGTLNTEGMSRQQLYDLYTGGFGLGETDLHNQLMQQAYEAYAATEAPEGQITLDGAGGGLSFGGESVTDDVVDDEVVEDEVVEDEVVEDEVVEEEDTRTRWQRDRDFIIQKVNEGTATQEQQEWYDNWIAAGSPDTQQEMQDWWASQEQDNESEEEVEEEVVEEEVVEEDNRTRWQRDRDYIIQQVNAGTASQEQQEWYDNWIAAGSPDTQQEMQDWWNSQEQNNGGVDDEVVDDPVVDDGPSDPFDNAYFDIGRSGVYEAGIYDSPNTEGYIQSFLTNKTWDEMTPQEQAAHAIMRGELSYYNTIDPEVYQAGIEMLQTETGDLMSNMGWYSRLEAIDRIRDREAEGITQGVSLSDALRRAGFQDIEGYDTFIDMVNQGLVDWDGDLNLESTRWNEWLLDDYNASRFTDLNNADLANYMYNQLGNIDLGVDVNGGPGSGPNGPLDDPDNPPWGWDGGYDWNWGDFQNGAPSMDGGGGYDPNDYAFDRYVPGQESPWGVPEIEGGNKDFYRNQFVNLLKDEQNFQNKQDRSRRNRWLVDRAQAGVQEAPDGMDQEAWENNWLRPNQPVALDWSWIEGGLPEIAIGGQVDWQRNSQYEGSNMDILNQLRAAGEIGDNTYRWFNNTWRQTGQGDSNWWQNTATYDRLNSMGDGPAGQAAYQDIADSLFTNYGTPEGVAAGYAAPVQGYNPRRLQGGPANQYWNNGNWVGIGQIAR